LTTRSTKRSGNWAPREPKPRILVAIDADETEERYLKQFANKTYPSAPDFKTFPRGKESPLGIVKFARGMLQTDDFTEAWCVFDEDEYREQGTLQKAVNLSKKKVRGKDIHLAVSSPSFELWLLLHFRKHLHDEPLHRDEALNRLCSEFARRKKTYDKTRLNPLDFEDGIDEAVKRAVLLCETHPPKTYKNPSSGVGYLVRRLTGQGSYEPC
jgi:hypothetical protein